MHNFLFKEAFPLKAFKESEHDSIISLKEANSIIAETFSQQMKELKFIQKLIKNEEGPQPKISSKNEINDFLNKKIKATTFIQEQLKKDKKVNSCIENKNFDTNEDSLFISNLTFCNIFQDLLTQQQVRLSSLIVLLNIPNISSKHLNKIINKMTTHLYNPEKIREFLLSI